jgi:hypothetical protein
MTDPRNLHDAAPGPSDAAVLGDGRPVIRCGCGFLAVADDQQDNQWAYTDHVERACPLAPVRPVVHRTEPWYAPLFSFWGFAIVLILCSAILAGMGVKW